MKNDKQINKGLARSLPWRYWFDNKEENVSSSNEPRKIDWLRVTPFVLLHLSCFFVFWVGISGVAIAIALALYIIRMFAITGFYHRYFSHRSFKTNRAVQFVFAIIGSSAAQRGPLWWAAHHRHHHAHADQASDVHSAQQHGFIWSHMGWFLCSEHFNTRHERIPDFSIFPELKFLDRFDVASPVLLAIFLFLLGSFLAWAFPNLNTSGWQILVWGFCVSTVMLYHATFMINSLAHKIGTRRYSTRDDSRNNWWLALITLGEGWHNNHHHYPATARQGFFLVGNRFDLLRITRTSFSWAYLGSKASTD
jgi:stearoyl-CoA desaturase (delta-9 desaturase)